MKKLVIAAFAISLTGCSSFFLKRKCNDINWFNHGEGVALQGKRLDQDDFILQCRKVEADVRDSELDLGFKKGMKSYCEPETVYQTGRKGQFFNKDMCGAGGLKILLARHGDGVKDYCHPKNGFTVGTTGTAYNMICPKNLESEFLIEFNKGRKVYLDLTISQRTEEISRNKSEISSIERKIQSLRFDLSDSRRRLSAAESDLRRLNSDQNLNLMSELRSDVDKYKGEVEDIDQQIKKLESDTQALERSNRTKNEEISNLRKEMIGL